jgi:hypothetical protein
VAMMVLTQSQAQSVILLSLLLLLASVNPAHAPILAPDETQPPIQPPSETPPIVPSPARIFK